jgi:hypothetical protein
MKQITLTLMALATLTIATYAQSNKIAIYPDLGGVLNSDGSWTQYIGKPVVIYRTKADQIFIDSKAEFNIELDNLGVATVTLPNGIAWNKSSGKSEYNHDGMAFQGLNSQYDSYSSAHADIVKNGFLFHRNQLTDSDAASPLALGESTYAKNIKSGKWRKFANGE